MRLGVIRREIDRGLELADRPCQEIRFQMYQSEVDPQRRVRRIGLHQPAINLGRSFKHAELEIRQPEQVLASFVLRPQRDRALEVLLGFDHLALGEQLSTAVQGLDEFVTAGAAAAVYSALALHH